jgi:2-polyprenyl-3-methyl-5-hydroxy-6-metoxy-1,4-benzoquinol methylase
MAEVASYKRDDHAFRGVDEYANAKYDITTSWLGLGRRGAAEGRTLANVGCGGGEYNLRAAALGLEVVACEPEEGAFRVALAGAAAAAERVRVLRMGLEELAAAQAPVDYLVMHDVLEHIADERGAVDATRKLLKPGGEAVLSVPAHGWLFGYHDEQLGHHRRYTRGRLLELFRDGWEVLRSRYYGAAFVPVTLVFSRWLRRPYPTRQASSAPWRRAAFRAACQAQRAVPIPFGTSVIVHVRKIA